MPRETKRSSFRIEEYDLHRDGEAVGILWADGLCEMLPPLLVETLLHPKVISTLVALAGFLLPLSPHLVPGYPCWILPTLPLAALLLVSCTAFLLVAALRIHFRCSKKIRIENTLTSDHSQSGEKKIIEQWVLRSRGLVAGCVTLYHEGGDRDGKTQVWLGHLTVAPLLRRQGWGSKLAAQAEAKAREVKAGSIRILVGNIKSRPFWLLRGYKRLYPSWSLLGHESIYMELDLKEDSHDMKESSHSVVVNGGQQYKGNMLWVSKRSQAFFLN